MSCEIFIRDVIGHSRSVSVNSEEELKNMTVKELIRRLYPEEDLDRYRYIFAGKQLEGDHTLGYYGIKNCSTIHTVLLIRGGGDPSCAPEDEGEGMSRTESMEVLANMQQTEPEPKR